MSAILDEVQRVYAGSSGEATTALYNRLEQLGLVGVVAINLFRACKASERAKVYRGRGYRGAAYAKKQWSLDNVAGGMTAHATKLGIVWGWGYDAKAVNFEHVLYVDLPTGQCSFHTDARGQGPDYPCQWDGLREQSADRIVRWCARLLGASAAETPPAPPPIASPPERSAPVVATEQKELDLG